jgi:hypothetical protein
MAGPDSPDCWEAGDEILPAGSADGHGEKIFHQTTQRFASAWQTVKKSPQESFKVGPHWVPQCLSPGQAEGHISGLSGKKNNVVNSRSSKAAT